MQRIMCFLLATLVCCASVQSQNPKLTFRSASFASGIVSFESFSEIDWDTTARQNFHGFDLEHPDATQLRDRWNEITNTADFAYTAPLPTYSEHLYYYLLSENGVVELHPQYLSGTISYAMSSATANPSAPRFFGEVSASAAAPIADGGFVFMLKAPTTFEITTVSSSTAPSVAGTFEYKDGNDVIDVYRDGKGHESKLEHDRMETPGIRKAYLVRIPESPYFYLMVRWMPDASNCEFKYSLYRMSDPVTKVAENLYGCDV